MRTYILGASFYMTGMVFPYSMKRILLPILTCNCSVMHICFGAMFGTQWLYSTWPTPLPAIADGDLFMAFWELYPIVAASIVWGKYWKTKCILFMCDNQATVRIVQKARSRETDEDTFMDNCCQ